MPRNSSARTVKTEISGTIDRHMKLYSIAAAAAGVSVFALAQPAEGEVVITQKTIPIPTNSYFGTFVPPTPISLNNNGINDFSFSLYSFAYHSFRDDLTVWPLQGGAVVASPNEFGGFYASALAAGAKIGPSAHFSSNKSADIERAQGFDASSHYSRKLYGNWANNPVNHYLGVKFLIDGATHYGWVRLTVTTRPHGFKATITGYAYETVANKPIFAGVKEGQPQAQIEHARRVSLGMLALGADGLQMWRREETQTTN
jgi:hypothetical protein